MSPPLARGWEQIGSGMTDSGRPVVAQLAGQPPGTGIMPLFLVRLSGDFSSAEG
jgi:hypothetical protein